MCWVVTRRWWAVAAGVAASTRPDNRDANRSTGRTRRGPAHRRPDRAEPDTRPHASERLALLRFVSLGRDALQLVDASESDPALWRVHRHVLDHQLARQRVRIARMPETDGEREIGARLAVDLV